MLIRQLMVSMLWVGLLVVGAGGASGQTYPTRPIRIITAPAGGSSDFLTRLIAQRISDPLGQQVVVDNRPADVIGELESKAAPDGYTLLMQGSVIWIDPLLRSHVAYDPVKDLAPVSLVATGPSVLVVHPSVPVKSVAELIALAKAKPGALNYASSGTGSAAHLSAELFKSMAGVNVVNVAYKGAAPAINALLGGEVQLMFPTAGSAEPYVKAGRLRALAITSAQPSALYPGLPAVAASGLPGFETGSMYGIWAPARTPATIINRLNQEIVRALQQPDMKEKFLNYGAEVAAGSPAQLAAAIKSDMAKWAKVIKEAGIRIE